MQCKIYNTHTLDVPIGIALEIIKSATLDNNSTKKDHCLILKNRKNNRSIFKNYLEFAAI